MPVSYVTPTRHHHVHCIFVTISGWWWWWRCCAADVNRLHFKSNACVLNITLLTERTYTRHVSVPLSACLRFVQYKFSLLHTLARTHITYIAYIVYLISGSNSLSDHIFCGFSEVLFSMGFLFFCCATVSSFAVVQQELPLLHRVNFSCIRTGKPVGYLWILNVTVDLAMICILSKIPKTQICAFIHSFIVLMKYYSNQCIILLHHNTVTAFVQSSNFLQSLEISANIFTANLRISFGIR